jgi:OmpA-OmpF porin, OOP family
MKKTLLLASLLLASGLAAAQTTNHTGFYVGGGVGGAWVDMGNVAGDIANMARSAGATNVTSDEDEGDTVFKLFAGYKFNKNFAIEGGYADLGKYTASASASSVGVSGNINGDVKAYAIFIDAVGFLPAGSNEDFSVFGKAGLAYTKTKANVSAFASATGIGSASASASDSDSEVVPKLGLGAQYYITKNVALRGEYDIYFNVGDEDKTGESNVQVVSATVTVGF